MGRPEQSTYAELDRTTVEAFAATFLPRRDCFPLQRPDGRYLTLKKHLYPDLVLAHLKGLITLGAYALDPRSQAKWLCLDADTTEQWRGLWQLAHHLKAQGVTAYLETSRRGGHLWLFFASLPGADARRFGSQLLAEQHLLDVELYPKQDRLHPGPGSLVRLPLGIHRKAGRRYHFLALAGQPLAPTIRAQVKLLTTPEQVPTEFISRVLARVPAPEPASPTPTLALPDEALLRALAEPLSARLKQRISVLEFVSRYVTLDEHHIGLCPFHDDHHPSFGVNVEQNFWHCWTCGSGGSIIDFAIRWREQQGEDASFTATLRALAQMLL